jgi:hypothetical protein
LGEFDHETQAFGLATTLGVASTTGIAGLTLGGGLGWLMGKFGLACDNVTAMDVVTADGRLLTASKSENADLFWGLRGGSGNFGIVTSFEYRLHEVGPVLAGGVFYPVEKARDVLRFYREFTSSCPDELSTQAGAFTTLDGFHTIAIGGCYCGPLDEGEKVLRRLRTFGPPAADLFAPMPYVQLQTMFDAYFPQGRHHYWKANFLKDLNDEAIAVLAESAVTVPSTHSFAPWLEHLHGAMSRVSAEETAFAHRQHPYNLGFFSIWTDPSEAPKNIKWTRDCWESMRKFMAPGAYVNYLEEEADSLARTAYGANYDRLSSLKAKYDPTNFFRLNHNILPAPARTSKLTSEREP